jgi:hypothetical protein
VRSAAALVAVAVLAGIAATAAAAHRSRALCGAERWAVKTLMDHPRLFPLQTTTLRYLTSLPAPPYLPPTRLPFERHVFRVTATVWDVRPEGDGDLHVLLRDGPYQMISEAPSPACDTAAARPLQRAMAAARRAVRVCQRASITGVAFFDYDHGQTGEAPNSIELHPILAFRCLSS